MCLRILKNIGYHKKSYPVINIFFKEFIYKTFFLLLQEVTLLKSEVSRLEEEAAASKIEAQTVASCTASHVAELQGLVDIQAEYVFYNLRDQIYEF